ncbi:MAG: thiolase family protein [Syntrophales bacterium]|nr:thiolase family protein [Syntrophales bacterium]
MHAVGVLEAGFCRAVLITYGHSARSSDSLLKMLTSMNADEAVFGHFGAAAGYALAARRAMHEFGTGPETWKHIAISQRKWANLNPQAVTFCEPMTEEDYFNSPWVVEPFRRADNCLITDGGRAIIVTTVERARNLRHPVVSIMGMGMHNPSAEVTMATHLTGPTGAKVAGEQALRMAGITIEEIDACEIYDCFTYTVEITLQDYGFFRRGEGRDWFSEGTIAPGGRLPVNTSGGLLSEAYQMGLTPLSEAVMQLRRCCGMRQLGPETGMKKYPEIILCSDNGGILQTHACYVLRRM